MADAPAPTTLKVRNFIDDKTLPGDLSYSLTNLSDAMQRQPGLIVHYSRLAALASKQVDDLKLLIEATETKIDREIRDAALAKGEKITESQLTKQVGGHPRIVALKRLLNEARQVEGVAKGAVEGFKHKRDMLIQEGASSRQEREGEIRTMSAGRREADLQAAKDSFLARNNGS